MTQKKKKPGRLGTITTNGVVLRDGPRWGTSTYIGHLKKGSVLVVVDTVQGLSDTDRFLKVLTSLGLGWISDDEGRAEKLRIAYVDNEAGP